MFELANRNLLLFLRDKATVLMSFLAEVIVVILYVLFIRNNLLEQFAYIKNGKMLMDVWMIAGILGITPVTTTMGAYGIMVEDRAKGVWKDLMITPIRKWNMVGGYILSATLIGALMSSVVLIFAELYMRQIYEESLLVANGSQLFLYILLVTVSDSSMVLFLISFLKSSNALASCCTILGALLGFLTGIYLPMGSLPSYVQDFVKVFPMSHGVVLFRQNLMKSFLKEDFIAVGEEERQAFISYMGIEYSHNGSVVTASFHSWFLIISGIVFLVLSVLHFTSMKER